MLAAARTAVVTLAVTGAAALVVAWLLASDSMSTEQVLVTAGALLCGAFGAGVEGQMSGSLVVVGGTAEGAARAVPLSLTLLAAATAVLTFRRATRTVRSGPLVLRRAAAASLLLALPVWLVALASRTDSGGILVALEWILPGDAGLVRGDAGVVAWQAPVGAFLVTLLALGLAALAGPHAWPPALAAAGAALAAPLRGLVTLALLLPVAGLLGLLMLAGGDAAPTGDPDAATGLGLLLAAVTTWGYAVLVLGALGPAGHTVDGTASGDLEVTVGTFHERLGHWTAYEPGLWASVPLAVAVLTVSARAVVRSSRGGNRVGADLLRWWGLLVPALPALGAAARLSGSGTAAGQVWGDEGEGELAGTLGVAPWSGPLSLLALAAAVGAVAWLLSRREGRRTLEETTVTPVTGGAPDGHATAPHP